MKATVLLLSRTRHDASDLPHHFSLMERVPLAVRLVEKLEGRLTAPVAFR